MYIFKDLSIITTTNTITIVIIIALFHPIGVGIGALVFSHKVELKLWFGIFSFANRAKKRHMVKEKPKLVVKTGH